MWCFLEWSLRTDLPQNLHGSLRFRFFFLFAAFPVAFRALIMASIPCIVHFLVSVYQGPVDVLKLAYSTAVPPLSRVVWVAVVPCDPFFGHVCIARLTIYAAVHSPFLGIWRSGLGFWELRRGSFLILNGRCNMRRLYESIFRRYRWSIFLL